MERLARGERVLDVALDLGYESPSAFAAMFRKALGEPPSAFAARGGVRLRVAGPARASGRKLARTWPEVSANLARGAPPCPQARGRGTGVLFSVSPVR